MSRIPRKSNIGWESSKVQKPSRKSNIPTQFGRKIGNRSEIGTPSAKGGDIFTSNPTMQALAARSVPKEIAGKPMLYGKPEQIETLFTYVRSLAQQLFITQFSKQLFPNSLSAITNISISNSTRRKSRSSVRNSSIAPDLGVDFETASAKLNLTEPFDQLKRLMKTKRSQMLAITDFCLLYSGLIVLVCENNDNQLTALLFVKQFLQLEIPNRPNELAILFACLVRQYDADPRVRGHAIEALAIMSDISQDVRMRVEAGAEHNRQELAEFCRDVLKLTTGSQMRQLKPPEFAEIPNEATAAVASDMLASFCESIESGNAPPDPVSFMENVVDTMRRFDTEPSILEKGAECLQNTLNLCHTIPVEIITWILELCFTILSGEAFLNGDDSFDAVEAIQKLSNDVFDKMPPEILLPAISGTIAETPDSHLPLLMNKLKEYVKYSGESIDPALISEIAATLDAFHPTFNGRPDFLRSVSEPAPESENLSESVRKLTDPDTVFEEMEAIVEHGDSTVIQNYPVYLRGFLQRAFYLIREIEPIGMTEEGRQLAEEMMENYRTMKDEDLLPGGRFSLDALSSQLEHMKNERSSW